MEFAVIAEDPALRQSDPTWDHVVSALNVQLAQDAAPLWGKPGTVSSYAAATVAPPGAVPIVVMKSPPPGVEGCHRWQNESASAVVRWRPGGAWSVAASHEILETLVDPTLEATRKGPDPRGGSNLVDCLLEVCDPCAGRTYPLGAGIEVSDFCLPAYYAKDGAGPFTKCNQPLHLWELGKQVSSFGYVTWSSDAGWLQLIDGSIRGPFSKEQLLANSLRHGTRGAVDRFKLFARPPHLRRKGPVRSRGQARSVKRPAKNQALHTWIRNLKKPR